MIDYDTVITALKVVRTEVYQAYLGALAGSDEEALQLHRLRKIDAAINKISAEKARNAGTPESTR